jgi:hypothetical protein
MGTKTLEKCWCGERTAGSEHGFCISYGAHWYDIKLCSPAHRATYEVRGDHSTLPQKKVTLIQEEVRLAPAQPAKDQYAGVEVT